MSQQLYTVTVPPAVQSATFGSPTSASSGDFNEGLAIFVTFGILFLLSTWDVTSKFALWVGIAIVALVYNNAYQSGQLKSFWNALSTL